MSGLIIDSFAGGGGASTGIERALGRSPDVAINHDPEAVALHTANHPGTMHYCQNIWQADPSEVVKAAGGGPVELAWFSPDCKHFSKAKGGKPVKKNVRDLAWVCVLWAKRARPRVIIVENVEEFEGWGPLGVDGLPCKARKGETFKQWTGELRRLGYRVQFRTLSACDYGAPTTRKRLFVVARCDGEPIVWPKPTHGPGRIPYRTAAECIDWSIPCPSIFERDRPLVDATLARIARGIERFVVGSADPFIVPVTHHGDLRTHSINEPLRTITTAQRGEFALISPFVSRQFGKSTGHAVDDPTGTITAGGSGKTALVTAFMAKHFGGMTGVHIDTPMPTMTTRGTQNQIVTSNLVKLKGTCRDGQPVTEPLHTVQAGGLHYAEVRAFMVKYYGEGGQHQDLRDPMHTLTTKARMGLVTVAGDDYAIVDIGMRMLTPRELFRAQGFHDDYIIDPEFNGKPMTKTAQVRMCGNSVCPDIANAIVRANFGLAAAYSIAA